MYAVIEDRGVQYKVEEGARILIASKRGLNKGDTVEFDRVILVSGPSGVKIGRPYVADARVKAMVEREVPGDKIYVVKFKRRKGYRRKQGHRQKYVEVKVQEIVS